MSDRAVGDVPLFTIQYVCLPIRGWDGSRLNVPRVGAGLRLGQGKGGQLLSRAKRGQPVLLLLLGAEQQKCPDANALMGVDENRRRGTTAADLLQDFAIPQLRKSASAIFLGRRRAQNTESSQARDDLWWNFGI